MNISFTPKNSHDQTDQAPISPEEARRRFSEMREQRHAQMKEQLPYLRVEAEHATLTRTIAEERLKLIHIQFQEFDLRNQVAQADQSQTEQAEGETAQA